MEQVAIVGSGHTAFGRFPEKSLEGLIVEAAREALADAELPAGDIDAVFLGHFNVGMVRDGFAASLVHQVDPALRFKPATRLENACASGSAAVYAGIQALQSGRARAVLVVGVEKMSERSTAQVTDALSQAGYQHDPAERELSFPQVFARIAHAYAERYGDPSAAMARVAVKNHDNAMQNPLAHLRRALSHEFCSTVSEKNPWVAEPLRLTDCSTISDGAAALVLTSSRAARGFPRKVSVLAACQVNDLLPMSGRDLLAFEGPKRAVTAARHRAGIIPRDLDFAEVHDCFTIAELLMYEALGLCGPGQGARVLAEGTVSADGAMPVNLSGGLKAKGHPIGATGVSMHALAFRQLTDRAIGLQKANARLGLVLNMGGAAVANYASILARMG